MPRHLSLVSALVVAAGAVAQPAAPKKSAEPPPPISITPSMPAALRLLTAPAVQKDVGLTPTQLETVEALTAEWVTPADTWALRGIGWLTPAQARAETARRTNAFLTKGLSKDQARRVEQIGYQLREKEFGAHAVFAASARALGLRDDQAEDIPNIQAARVDEITRLVLSGERFAAVRPKVAASNADAYEKMAEMLTRTQREKLKDLRGKTFAGEVDPAFFAVPASAVPKVRRSVYPPASFNEFDFELLYLKNEAVQRELKGAADQIVGWNRIIPPERSAANYSKTWGIIREHLTAAQQKRFHELMIRRRLVIGGVEAALGYPVVVDRLQLTGTQLKALADGDTADAVLSKDQQQRWAEGLVGEPFEFDVVDGDEHFEALRKAKALAARAADVVAKPKNNVPPSLARSLLLLSGRLEMSDDQIKQLREIAEDMPKMQALIEKELGFPDGQHTAGADRGLTTAHAVQNRYRDVAEAQSWKVLDAKQQSLAKKMMGRGK
ncbi:MAG TPA: hypothetical protein VM597_33420 [Gemmataceae bacterium]|nr:hypothetical protein [Gemmataceae bacterium]